jgi:DNA-binding transcriptional LysR family regulator
MDRLTAMQAFVHVVEAGSFVRAAEKLGTSTSSTSRLIAELETHLGARLLNRTTRRLSLTETGQAYYERCVQLLADLDEAEAAAGAAAAAPSGRLKLTCPYNLLAQPIAPALAEFGRRHPQVGFDVTVADRLVDLVDEGFDLAVRIGAPGGEQLVARRLGSTQLVACASPAYLAARGAPRAPADLAAHSALTYAYVASPFVWRLADAEGRQHEVRVGGSLHANSGELLVAAALAGMGIVFEPDFVVGPHLARGELRRVLPRYSGPKLDVWAVYPSRRHLSAKVRTFVDFLAGIFAADPLRPHSPAGDGGGALPKVESAR